MCYHRFSDRKSTSTSTGPAEAPSADGLQILKSRRTAKVTVALERIATGHTAAIKSVGLGVSEYRIDFGPGYRIYFGRQGDLLVILLGGGSKKRQQADIEAAQAAWKDYKARRRTER